MYVDVHHKVGHGLLIGDLYMSYNVLYCTSMSITKLFLKEETPVCRLENLYRYIENRTKT